MYTEHALLSIDPLALPYLLLALLGIAEFSDLADGYLARRYNEVTELGKILDPMADSIYRLSIFLTFTLPPIRLPMILLFVLFYRDTFISTLRTLCALRGFTLAARMSGKLKAVMQALTALALIALLIPYSLNELSEERLSAISTVLVSCTSLYTVLSGGEYLYANRHYIIKSLLPNRS